MDSWELADIPDQAGRLAIVTGTSLGGIGYFVALELARRGARVVLAGRSEEKLDVAASAIEAELGGDQPLPESLVVDLADLGSVREAAAEAAALGPVDLLVNNAGVMGLPPRPTADGLDRVLATNHLGPFLLTGLLLPQLAESGAGRVVTVSSALHRRARHAPLEDPRQPRRVGRAQAYARSKLANLLFTAELDRRCRDAAVPVAATAAHPGFASTRLTRNGYLARSPGAVASVADAAIRVVAQPAEAGAWPVLMAATADLPGGTYCGPGGRGEMSGAPRVVGTSEQAQDEDAARRLWQVSEEAVGLRYP